ncbi:MAG: SDR family NAD(P)-dependent oxidoreductase [Acidimicrobiia bacterium]
MNRLDDKVAIVTGSTKGIGRVIAAMMAAEGAKVVLAGRTKDRGEKFAAEIKAGGGEATFVQADIGTEDGVTAVIAGAIAAYGKITTLVNNAASTDLINSSDATVVDVSFDAWEQIFRVTVGGAMLMAKYAVPKMIEAGGGAVVNVSSEASYRPPPGMAAYAAAKAAMNSLSRSIAVEYGDRNIRSNAVITGMVLPPAARERFEAHPVLGPKLRSQHLTRPGRREDIANAVVFLASDESAYITGAELPVEGGTLVKTSLMSKEDIFDASV